MIYYYATRDLAHPGVFKKDNYNNQKLAHIPVSASINGALSMMLWREKDFALVENHFLVKVFMINTNLLGISDDFIMNPSKVFFSNYADDALAFEEHWIMKNFTLNEGSSSSCIQDLFLNMDATPHIPVPQKRTRYGEIPAIIKTLYFAINTLLQVKGNVSRRDSQSIIDNLYLAFGNEAIQKDLNEVQDILDNLRTETEIELIKPLEITIFSKDFFSACTHGNNVKGFTRKDVSYPDNPIRQIKNLYPYFSYREYAAKNQLDLSHKAFIEFCDEKQLLPIRF